MGRMRIRINRIIRIIRMIRPLTKKKWDSEGIQLKCSVFFVYSLIEVCLTYPDRHYAGWIEPDNPGFCQRTIPYNSSLILLRQNPPGSYSDQRRSKSQFIVWCKTEINHTTSHHSRIARSFVQTGLRSSPLQQIGFILKCKCGTIVFGKLILKSTSKAPIYLL